MNTELSEERQEKLWADFVESYTTTTTRGTVDLFLRALVGHPRPEPDPG